MSREESIPASTQFSGRSPAQPAPPASSDSHGHGPRGDATALLLRQGWRRAFASLENRHYRILWLSMLASFMGMQMHMVARGWLAYDITGSAAALGAVSLAWGLPMLLFSLLGGVLADYAEKRNILVASQVVTTVMAVAHGVLVATGVIQIWQLMILGFFQGTVFAFQGPGRQALVPELVGEHELMNAIALNSAGMNMTRIVGPSLAGLFIALPFIGMNGIFFVIAAFYVAATVTLLMLPLSGNIRIRERPMITEMFSGFGYIGRHPLLITFMSLAFVPILLGMPYQSLLPVFAGNKALGVGPSGLGAMMTATGVGALVGSVGVANLSEAKRLGLIQLVFGLAFGLTLVFFALSQNYVMALLTLPLVGLTANAFMAINNTMILGSTDPEMRGRVMSIYWMTFSVMPLVAFPMGIIGDAVGIQATVAVAGGLIAAFIVGVAILYPSHRNMEWEPLASDPVPAVSARTTLAASNINSPKQSEP